LSWPIRLHTERPERPHVGDMFPAPHWLDPACLKKLSPAYLAERRQKRQPLVVVLPGGAYFCIDCRAWSEGKSYGDGWTVTGEPPNVTLSPSINIIGHYHGWIQNGVITDDCEGRTFA